MQAQYSEQPDEMQYMKNNNIADVTLRKDIKYDEEEMYICEEVQFSTNISKESVEKFKDYFFDLLKDDDNTEKTNLSKEILIDGLKKKLANYDYIGVKIAMGVATREDYQEEIAETEKIRQMIRELSKTSASI